VLVPELKPGDVLVWGNRKPHKSEEAVEAAGARVVPLPRYSPDLTPIEETASKVKGSLARRAGQDEWGISGQAEGAPLWVAVACLD
jgi:transposase